MHFWIPGWRYNKSNPMNIFQFWAAMACPLTGWQSPLRTWLLPGFSNSAMCGTDPPYFTVRGTYFLCQVVNVGNLCHGVLNTNGTLAKRVTEKNRGVQRRWYIMIGSISLMFELGSPIIHSVRIHYTTVPQFTLIPWCFVPPKETFIWDFPHRPKTCLLGTVLKMMHV